MKALVRYKAVPNEDVYTAAITWHPNGRMWYEMERLLPITIVTVGPIQSKTEAQAKHL